MGTKIKGLSVVYFHHNANCTTVRITRRVRNKPRKGIALIPSYFFFKEIYVTNYSYKYSNEAVNANVQICGHMVILKGIMAI